MKPVKQPVMNGWGWKLQRIHCCGEGRINHEGGDRKWENMQKKKP